MCWKLVCSKRQTNVKGGFIPIACIVTIICYSRYSIWDLEWIRERCLREHLTCRLIKRRPPFPEMVEISSYGLGGERLRDQRLSTNSVPGVRYSVLPWSRFDSTIMPLRYWRCSSHFSPSVSALSCNGNTQHRSQSNSGYLIQRATTIITTGLGVRKKEGVILVQIMAMVAEMLSPRYRGGTPP